MKFTNCLPCFILLYYRSLFEILAEADEKKASKRADFAGRIEGSKVAKLYPYFGQKEVETKLE